MKVSKKFRFYVILLLETNKIKKGKIIMKEIIKATIQELLKKNLIKQNDMSAYKKTELLLYNYNNFCNAINWKKEQIEEIKKEGLLKKSKGINLISVSNRNFEDEFDKKQNKIEALENSISLTSKVIYMTDMALASIKKDPYYQVIILKYFKSNTLEEIASKLEKDISTIGRNKARLINNLKIKLFSDDVIKELIG